MRSFVYVITDRVGIHARPAGMLVKEAQQYRSEILVSKGEKEADAKNLMQIMAGVADPRCMDYRFSADETSALEQEIDRIENSFPRAKEFVLYGGCEQSARLDVARAVARRAERRFRKVEQNYGADAKAIQYINRLSDYLYMCARYADHRAEHERADKIQDQVIRNIMKNI